MRVEPLVADATPGDSPNSGAAGGFAQTLDALAKTLGGAERAEDAFARGSGSLQDAIYERARADVALSVATAAAQRLVQSLSAVLNMQV
ncbi:MAG TPA: flagellar hook-basal body complex protein FliE [Candidatus Cybelea sp.]|jgi:flagellar hook-basal body complex protein FliE